MRVDRDYKKWWDASSKGGEKGVGYWYKNDTNRADVNVSGHKTLADFDGDIPDSYSPTPTKALGYVDLLTDEDYLKNAIHSENVHTAREAKTKLAKLEYYKNLNK